MVVPNVGEIERVSTSTFSAAGGFGFGFGFGGGSGSGSGGHAYLKEEENENGEGGKVEYRWRPMNVSPSTVLFFSGSEVVERYITDLLVTLGIWISYT